MAKHNIRHHATGRFAPKGPPRTTLQMAFEIVAAKRKIRSVGKGAPHAPLQHGRRTKVPAGTPRWRGTDHRI